MQWALVARWSSHPATTSATPATTQLPPQLPQLPSYHLSYPATTPATRATTQLPPGYLPATQLQPSYHPSYPAIASATTQLPPGYLPATQLQPSYHLSYPSYNPATTPAEDHRALFPIGAYNLYWILSSNKNGRRRKKTQKAGLELLKRTEKRKQNTIRAWSRQGHVTPSWHLENLTLPNHN
jgi:hypothetical protein